VIQSHRPKKRAASGPQDSWLMFCAGISHASTQRYRSLRKYQMGLADGAGGLPHLPVRSSGGGGRALVRVWHLLRVRACVCVCVCMCVCVCGDRWVGVHA
jgi:hypothetical protein